MRLSHRLCREPKDSKLSSSLSTKGLVPHPHRHSFRVLLVTYTLDLAGYALAIPVLASFLLHADYVFFPTGASDASRMIWLGFLLATFGVSQSIAGPIVGMIADCAGRRITLILTVTADIVGWGLMVWASYEESLVLLLMGRAWTGFSSGNFGLILSSCADMAPASARSKLFAHIFGLSTVGFLLGPIVGGFTSKPSLLHGSLPFALMVIAKLLNLGYVTAFFSETLPKYKRGLKIRQQLRTIFPILRQKGMVRTLVAFFLFCLGWNFFLQFQPPYYIRMFKMDSTGIGWMYATISITWAIGALLINRWLVDRLSLRRIAILMHLLAGTILAALYWMQDLWQVILVVAGLGALVGIYFSDSNALISQSARRANQGKLLGLNQSLWSIGQVMASVSAGFIAAVSVSQVMITGGVCLLAGGVFLVRMPEPS